MPGREFTGEMSAGHAVEMGLILTLLLPPEAKLGECVHSKHWLVK